MLTPATGTLPPAATARKIAAFVGLSYNAPSELKLRKTTKFQQKRRVYLPGVDMTESGYDARSIII